MARPQTITDQEILRLARPVFLRHGIRARTRDVAAAVGLTWGAIALRFGSKRALFERTMDHRHCAEPAAGQADAADLRALLRQMRSLLAQHWPMHLQLSLASGEPVDRDRVDGLIRWLASALRRHADRGEVRADLPADGLATVLLATLVGDAAQRFIRSRRADAPDDALIEAMLRLIDAKGN